MSAWLLVAAALLAAGLIMLAVFCLVCGLIADAENRLREMRR